MTIGEHLVNVADAGLAISMNEAGVEVFMLLNVLLSIEDTLDKGRVVAGMSDLGKEHIPLINQKMDALRSRIADMIDGCDTDEYRQFREVRDRGIHNQFRR